MRVGFSPGEKVLIATKHRSNEDFTAKKGADRTFTQWATVSLNGHRFDALWTDQLTAYGAATGLAGAIRARVLTPLLADRVDGGLERAHGCGESV